MIRYEDRGSLRYMYCGTNVSSVMGSMHRDLPVFLADAYTDSMSAWLLFESLDELSQLHAMQLGLGPGCLTKYNHNFLKMRTTAVEIDPHVVAASRDFFLLPPNGEKLQVIVGDAAVEIAKPERQGSVDVLQVDLFDAEGQRPVLDDPEFWATCRSSLTPKGCMTANLYGESSSYDPWDSVERIRQVFSTESVWVLLPAVDTNVIVIARNLPMPQDILALVEHTNQIKSRFFLDASNWLHQLQCPLPASPA